MHSLRLTFAALAGCALALLTTPAAHAQGSLTPPAGAPAPAMKSLDQIEPRTDVLTLPGDAEHDHVIATPGSYFLSRSLLCTSGKSGILIAADDVTLDLGGFEIRYVSGDGGLPYWGIRAISPHRNLAVRHGTLSNWFRHGLGLIQITGGVYEHLRVIGNDYGGMTVGPSSIVRHCTSQANGPGDGGVVGIHTGSGSLIESCVSRGELGAAGTGIETGAGSTIVHSTVTGHTAGGSTGIDLGIGSVARDCAVSFNTGAYFRAFTLGSHNRAEHCVATHNSGLEASGFKAWDSSVGATLAHCTAAANGGAGVSLGSRGTILDCTVTANGAHGIHLLGSENVVERCVLSHNTGRGLLAAGPNNLIVANRAHANTAGNFSWVGGNKNAVVLTVTASFANTDPTANLAY